MCGLGRADLAVAIGEYAISEAHLQLAVARQYPQLTVNPGYYWDHGIAKFPFDVSFILPVNGNEGEIAEARSARDIAGKHLLALQADIYGEISAAERAESLARTGAETAERRLETARRQLQQSDLGADAPNKSEFEVQIDPDSARSATEIDGAIRRIFEKYPNELVEINSVLAERIGETLSGESAPFSVSVMGSDLDADDQVGEQIVAVLRQLPHSGNVRLVVPPRQAELQITLQLDK